MKHEFEIEQPPYLIEDWPDKYEIFSWMEYVVTVPNPIFIVTTRKANGAPNANLQSWGLLIGERGDYSSLMALGEHSHTYSNILREEEWCICFPSFKHYPQCFETIYCNAPDNDEIAESGFTLEPAKIVQAPRIAECLVCLECRLAWHHPLYAHSHVHLFVGKVVHLAVDTTVMVPDPAERMRNIGLMYNVRSTVNPSNGTEYGPNSLGLLNEVVKIFTDEGVPLGWRIPPKGK